MNHWESINVFAMFIYVYDVVQTPFITILFSKINDLLSHAIYYYAVIVKSFVHA